MLLTTVFIGGELLADSQRDVRADETAGDGLTTRCATHPNVETRLRCGKCDRPICPRCLVFTPVGARCRACADLKPLPQYHVQPVYYARALLVALGAALAQGVVWAVLSMALPFVAGFLVIGVGYFSGELVSRSVNRKSNRGLQAIAAVTVLAAYAVRGIVLVIASFGSRGVTASLMLDIVFREFAGLFASPLALLIFALAIYIAISRIR